MDKEIENAKLYGITKFAKEVIDVADNLRLVVKSINQHKKEGQIYTRAAKVQKMMFETLAKFDIRALESDGQPFNPHFHQAIAELPSPTKEQEGLVLTTTQNGYTIKDRVLRSAKVCTYRKQ